MIDDEEEVYELIEALKEHLPMRAYATPPLVNAVQDGVDIKMNEAVEIDSVLYLGDEGGIACAIGMWGGNCVVTSITHLRIDRDHPLAERIEAYQLRRSQQLGAPTRRSSRSARAKLAANETKAEGSTIGALQLGLTEDFQGESPLTPYESD